MIEVRIHGRGGQGAVIASKLLASAIFSEGKYVQCFPAIGVERRGAPVAAFLRVDDRFIYLRTDIAEPDHVVVLDQRLIVVAPVTEGLKPNGIILINSARSARSFSSLQGYRVYTIDANQIAGDHGLGSETAPIVNTVMAAAFLKVSQLATIEGLCKAIEDEVPIKRQANIAASNQAYARMQAFVGTAMKGEAGE
ncbi:MAG: 2-oxoacid:acceptor oxidoreductase family protein [Deltaproteobacteria bacterium]|nr:2-oxoacid:acceptor oxidoreductase family protein [Deltaproteobacteria bacterium]